MRTRIGSDDARRWVRSLRLGNPYAKAVLMAFTNYVNDDGTAYPGLETIHGDTEIAINTITARLRWCESIGAVTVSKCWVDEHGNRNKVGRGRPTSWEIRFLLDADVEAIAAAANEQTPDRPLRGAALTKHEEKNGADSSPLAPEQDEISQSPGEGLEKDLPISSQSVANHLPITGATRILESESEEDSYPQTPFREEAERGFESPIDEDSEKRFEQFKRTYPQGILDLDAARAEFFKLSVVDQVACLKGLAVYADRCRARKEKSMKAHLFVRKRCWEGLLADPKVSAPSTHPLSSEEGRALMTLARVMRFTPLILNNNVIFPGEITPRIRALATAPHPDDWMTAERGTGNYAAWREFGWSVWPGKGFSLGTIDIPWDWPPRKDGSIIAGTDPPPGELSDVDVEALTVT